MGSTRCSYPETLSQYSLQFQEVKHVRPSHSVHRNQEGPVRCRGVEDPSQLRAAWAVRTGCGRVLGIDRQARSTAALRVELQSILRHEGPRLVRSGKEVQGDEKRPRVSQE